LVVKDPPLSPLPRGENNFEYDLQENEKTLFYKAMIILKYKTLISRIPLLGGGWGGFLIELKFRHVFTFYAI